MSGRDRSPGIANIASPLPVAQGGTGNKTGLAATATALATARTIGGTSFDGTANITVATATAGFTVTGGALVAPACTTGIPAINLPSGTLETTPASGDIEYDGGAFYGTADTTQGRTLLSGTGVFRLTANGSAIGPSIADYFGSNSAFSTVTNGVYEIVFYCLFLKSTAGTVTFTITNTQTYTNIVAMLFSRVANDMGSHGAIGGSGIVTTTTAAAALPATTSISDTNNVWVEIRAIAECGTAGNIRLRVTSSAGTVTPLRGSYYTVRRLPAANVGVFVA